MNDTIACTSIADCCVIFEITAQYVASSLVFQHKSRRECATCFESHKMPMVAMVPKVPFVAMVLKMPIVAMVPKIPFVAILLGGLRDSS